VSITISDKMVPGLRPTTPIHPMSTDMCLEAGDDFVVVTHRNYTVKVYTGSRDGAGTDADVYITLFGYAGECRERQLDTTADDFEAGS